MILPKMVAGGCTLREYRSIADVPACDWDSLVDPGDLQASRRFVAVCEESGVENAEYRHLLVYRGGEVVAIATLNRMDIRLDLLSTGIVRRAASAVRRHRDDFLRLPLVVCGLPVSFAQSLLRLSGSADGEALRLIHDAMESFAASTGSPVLCLKEFNEAELPALNVLSELSYVKLWSLPSCRLYLPFRTFNDYAAAMRAPYRRQLLATLRTAAAAGLTVRRVADWRPECPRIFPLYEQVIERAAFRLERLNAAFFDRLALHFAGDSSALLVERQGQLLAAGILLHAPGVTTFLLAGIDYATHRESGSYRFLVTAIVQEAIRRGDQLLELGQTSYDLKRRLGAETTTRHLFLRARPKVVRPLLRAAGGILFPESRLAERTVFKTSL